MKSIAASVITLSFAFQALAVSRSYSKLPKKAAAKILPQSSLPIQPQSPRTRSLSPSQPNPQNDPLPIKTSFTTSGQKKDPVHPGITRRSIECITQGVNCGGHVGAYQDPASKKYLTACGTSAILADANLVGINPSHFGWQTGKRSPGYNTCGNRVLITCTDFKGVTRTLNGIIHERITPDNGNQLDLNPLGLIALGGDPQGAHNLDFPCSVSFP